MAQTNKKNDRRFGTILNVSFGSTAASQYFITWAAGFDQKQSLSNSDHQ